MKNGYFTTKYASFKEVIVAASQKTFVDEVNLKFLYRSLDDVKKVIESEQKTKINPSDLLIGCVEVEDEVEEIELTKGNTVYQIQGERKVAYYINKNNQKLTIDDVNKGIEAINAKRSMEQDLLEKELRGNLEQTGIIPVLKNQEKKRIFLQKSQANLIKGLEELSKRLPDSSSRTITTYYDSLADRIAAVEKEVPEFAKVWRANETVKKILDKAVAEDKEFMPLINGGELATKTVVDVQEKESKEEESKEEETSIQTQTSKVPGGLYDIRFI